MNKQLLASLALLAVVAVVGVVYPRPLPTQVVKETIEKLGAFPGPEILSDFLSFNGIKKHYYRASMRAATTTPCVWTNRTGATTTLLWASADFVISSTTQTTIATFGRGAGTFSTTTSVLGALTLTDSLKGRLLVTASSTGADGGVPSTFQFAPKDNLVLGFAGGQHPTSGQPTGTCQAEFAGY